MSDVIEPAHPAGQAAGTGNATRLPLVGAATKGLRAGLKWWPAARPLLWVGVSAVATAVFAMILMNPPAPDGGVAAAWNESISKLGVWPIYPPEEDFYVGDLWAVLITSDADKRSPLLITGARINHIDLSYFLKSDEARRIRFHPDQPGPGAATSPIRRVRQPSVAVSDEVSPSLVGFPGVSILHDRKDETWFGWRWLGWGASNEGSVREEIHITDASSYGVQLGDANGELLGWCSAEGADICTDKFARRILSAAGIDKALDHGSDRGSYTYPIELRLISRVFLARTIVQRRSSNDVRELAASTGLEGGTPGSPAQQTPPPNREGSPAKIDTGQVPLAENDQARNGAGGLFSRSSGSSVEMSKTYERPIVFAYRAASRLLTPSKYEEEESTQNPEGAK